MKLDSWQEDFEDNLELVTGMLDICDLSWESTPASKAAMDKAMEELEMRLNLGEFADEGEMLAALQETYDKIKDEQDDDVTVEELEQLLTELEQKEVTEAFEQFQKELEQTETQQPKRKKLQHTPQPTQPQAPQPTQQQAPQRRTRALKPPSLCDRRKVRQLKIHVSH